MPKGIYKRKKETVKVKEIAPVPIIDATEESIKEAFIEPVKEQRKGPIGHPVYMPSPDMGNIKPPSGSKDECNCAHIKETHYGGPNGWCNSPGCGCLEFR